MFSKDHLVTIILNPKFLDDNEKQRQEIDRKLKKEEREKQILIYTVQKGDNLYKVAEIFRQNINHIRQINKLIDSGISLTPGTKIKVIDKANRELYPDIDRYL